jgi:hypothetical protein
MHAVLVAWLAAGVLLGQQTPLDRLKREAARMKAGDGEVKALHLALRDWIEAHLPPSARTPVEFRNVEETLQRELKATGLSLEDAPNEGWMRSSLGYVGFEMKWLPELPDGLFFTASVAVPCGTEDAIYLYRFDAHGRERVFEERPTGYGYPNVELADMDSQGRRLVLANFVSTQCASTWMGMAYSVYRLGLPISAHDLLLSGQHSFWLSDDSPTFVLKPDELMIEFRDYCVDALIHNRTNIERFNFADGVRRLDPVAFQPQDFVEEWLVRPWSEMQARSVESTKAWHERLHKEAALGQYAEVTHCSARPGRWLIGLEDPKSSTTYFLVHELGKYRYQMEAIGTARPSGCPGDGDPSDKHPYLTEDELKALR